MKDVCSVSHLVTIETFYPVLCSSAHTNNNLSLNSLTIFFTCTIFLLLLFPFDVSTLTFCINVSYRPMVNGCILSPMFENKWKYNTIQLDKCRWTHECYLSILIPSSLLSFCFINGRWCFCYSAATALRCRPQWDSFLAWIQLFF